jgi:UDP-glucuronate decarboxylase
MRLCRDRSWSADSRVSVASLVASSASLMQDENNLIICLDNCFSGNKSNVEKWFGNPRFEFIRHDVTEQIALEVDQIYHLACPASPVFYQNIKTNVLGTMNMLGLAKRLKARFLISSTSEVYGDPDVHPQVEEYWSVPERSTVGAN